jgi:hypothetical protein
LVLAHRALIDLPTVLICLLTLSVLFIVKRIPEPVVILTAGLIGIGLTSAS